MAKNPTIKVTRVKDRKDIKLWRADLTKSLNRIIDVEAKTEAEAIEKIKAELEQSGA